MPHIAYPLFMICNRQERGNYKKGKEETDVACWKSQGSSGM